MITTLRLAANQGDPKAQFSLGLIYDNGRGVPQDFVEAAKWYRKAARQGHAEAQDILGVMHVNGEGVSMDYVLAHMWFSLSAAQGSENAAKNRDMTATMMTPEQLAIAQRLAREWKPAARQ